MYPTFHGQWTHTVLVRTDIINSMLQGRHTVAVWAVAANSLATY